MNRIEQFLLGGTKPFISSYYSPMLSSLVSTKGAEYPFVPLLETRSLNSFIRKSVESDSCGFDSIAKTLELKLYGANQYEENAYSIFWETVWDGLVSYFLDLLTLVPDVFGAIKDIIEWFFALFEPNSEELAELQTALAGFGAWIASFNPATIAKLTEEIADIENQINIRKTELKEAFREEKALFNWINQLDQEYNRLDELLNDLIDEFREMRGWGEGTKKFEALQQQIIDVNEKLKSTLDHRNELSSLLKGIRERLALLNERLDHFRKLLSQKLLQLPAANPLSRSIENLKNLLIRIVKRLLKVRGLRNILRIIGVFAAGIGGVILAGVEVITAILAVVGVVVLIIGFDALLTSISNACKQLVASIMKANDDRRAAVDTYFDEVDLKVSTGCCDVGVCKTPSGEFDGCPQIGCGSGSGSSGMGVGAFIGGKMFFNSETVKHCGYRPGCFSLPNCTSYTYPVPSGDSQPYTNNTWKYNDNNPISASDSRIHEIVFDMYGRIYVSVDVPDPRSACGWRESYEFSCPDWDAVKTQIRNGFNLLWQIFVDSGGIPSGRDQTPAPITETTPIISQPPTSSPPPIIPPPSGGYGNGGTIGGGGGLPGIVIPFD